MKNTLYSLLFVVLLIAMVSGCAKRPAATVTPGPMEEGVVSSTPSSEDVTGYGDGSMSSSMVGDKTGFEALTGEPVSGMTRIHFDFDQFTLTAEAREILAANVDFMKANPALNVLIEGHCDERGSDEYNLALGERRANAAKSYMVSLGIAPSRLSIVSLGEEMPLELGHDESAWAQNRRDEFKPVR